MTAKQYRLVTRSDFDGLVCAVLLKHLDMVSDIKFVHPKDMQDGKVDIDDNDITTNLPFVPGVHLAFDHHHSETLRNEIRANHIIDPKAPSAARVVFDHYGGFKAFPESWGEMMAAVDKADSAQYDREDIVNPKNWELLNFIMDARTGLGRFREFRISNYELMMQLIDYCASHDIDEILDLPDVKERVDMYKEHHLLFMDQIKQNTTVYKNLVVLNLQEQDPIWAGNRFMIYALYPETNISIHRMWGLKKQNTVFAVGKSIIDRSSKTNVGELMLQYGGGGHLAAGTCQVENDKAEEVLAQLVETINADG